MRTKVFTIIAYLFSLALLISCSAKPTVEKLEDRYNIDKCKELLEEVLSEHIAIDWDSIAYDVIKREYDLDYKLIIDGYGKSAKYGNERFHVKSVWSLLSNGKSEEFLTVTVKHKELGEIISISGKNKESYSITDSVAFKEKLFEKRKKVQEVAKEHANYIQLSNKNKTKVHFGMSRDEYYQLGREFQKYFYDGLIGKRASEFAKPLFVNDKFVGFDINDHHSRASYTNIYSYAKEVKTHYSKGVRYDRAISYYVSDIYNLEIQELISNIEDNSVTIRVYWNAYSKPYAK